MRIGAQRFLDSLFVVDHDAFDRSPRDFKALHAYLEAEAHPAGAAEIGQTPGKKPRIAALVGGRVGAAHQPGYRMLERRLDRKALLRRLDLRIHALSSELLGLSFRAFEFADVLVQVQDAPCLKIVTNARIAAQLAQLLAAVPRESKSGFGVAAGPTRQTFKEEAHAPKPLGEVGAWSEEQRGVLAPEPLQDL